MPAGGAGVFRRSAPSARQFILRGRRAYPIKRRRKMGMNRKLWLTAEKSPFSQVFHRDTDSPVFNFLLSFR